MCGYSRKEHFLWKIAVILGCTMALPFVHGEGDENASSATPSSTPRSILVLKISPNFKSHQEGDDFIRNLNRRLEGYKKKLSEYETVRGNSENIPPGRNSQYPSYDYPYKPAEDLNYHTNVILYFIGISVIIIAIGVLSCLCINKSSCQKCLGEISARNDSSSHNSNSNNSSSRTRRVGAIGNNGNLNRGSRVSSSISVISGTTASTSFSVAPSVVSVNAVGIDGVNSSQTPSDHIQIKVMPDLPPSYESLFPPPPPTCNEHAEVDKT